MVMYSANVGYLVTWLSGNASALTNEVTVSAGFVTSH